MNESRCWRQSEERTCAWCGTHLPNMVQLLEHVDDEHLEPRNYERAA